MVRKKPDFKNLNDKYFKIKDNEKVKINVSLPKMSAPKPEIKNKQLNELD